MYIAQLWYFWSLLPQCLTFVCFIQLVKDKTNEQPLTVTHCKK